MECQHADIRVNEKAPYQGRDRRADDTIHWFWPAICVECGKKLEVRGTRPKEQPGWSRENEKDMVYRPSAHTNNTEH